MKEAHVKYLKLDPNSRQVDGNHYKAPFQHWDLVPILNLPWQESCAIKYLERCFKKGKTVIDLEKSAHYAEKLISLVLQGVVQGKPNSQLVAFGHIKVYEEWIKAQDFKAPTPELAEKQVNLLRMWSRWSWSEKSYSVDDQVDSLIAIVEATFELLSMYQEYVKAADLLKTEEPSGEEAGRAYNAQSLDPTPPPEVAPPTPPTPPEVAPAATAEAELASAVEAASTSASAEQEVPKIILQLREAGAGAFNMLQMQRPQSVPFLVFAEMLDAYATEKVTPSLDTSKRYANDGSLNLNAAFTDWQDPMYKIQVGLEHLSPALADKQLVRTLVAMAAIQDGLTCLTEWLLRMTEGPCPAISDPVEQDKVRIAGLVLRREIAQRSAKCLEELRMTPYEYNTGMAEPKGPLTQEEPKAN